MWVTLGMGYGGCGKECEGVESEGFRGRLDTNGIKAPLLFLPNTRSTLPSPTLPPLPSPSPLQAAGTSLFSPGKSIHVDVIPSVMKEVAQS